MRNLFFAALASLILNSCADGDTGRSGGLDAANFDCDGACNNQNLSETEVRQILGQAIAAAESLGQTATISIVDRVGNVLALYQMQGAKTDLSIDGQISATGGLEGLNLTAAVGGTLLAAISKAATGAFLSSQGNAFSTRTASQIIQENFNPAELRQPGGPLFGVQFSQLICSDVMTLNPEVTSGRATGVKETATGLVGPRPLPLGLSADPGGLPLYQEGDLVGGVGIEVDGIYRLDRNIQNFDDDIEERIALMATRNFEAPSQRVAPNVNAGKSFRYTDLGYEDLDQVEAATIDNARLVALGDYAAAGAVRDGAIFGTAASGLLSTTRAGVNALVLVDAAGDIRYPTTAGTALAGGEELRAAEVDALLDSALLTANRTRAAIRRPLDASARVSIWIVDHLGTPLGFTRSQDAPVFGIDVALQKARTAAFFSSADAGDVLISANLTEYVTAAREFIASDALTGTHAFTDRAGGNLSRPFYPDGINGKANGPFSLPFPGTDSSATETWSPFNTGLQFDIVSPGILQSIDADQDIPDTCSSNDLATRLENGIQIFPGSVPLYRGGVLIGAIGVSGDGIDQDDLISFYGASRQGLDFAGHTAIGDATLGFNAPKSIRADRIVFADGTRLRYVRCPEAPFIGDNTQNVCEGL